MSAAEVGLTNLIGVAGARPPQDAAKKGSVEQPRPEFLLRGVDRHAEAGKQAVEPLDDVRPPLC